MYNAVILLIYGVMESERLFILKNNLAQCVSQKRTNRIRGVRSKKKKKGKKDDNRYKRRRRNRKDHLFILPATTPSSGIQRSHLSFSRQKSPKI